MKKFSISLRFSILSIFVTLFVVIILIIALFFHIRTSRSLLQISEDLQNQLATTIIIKLNHHLETPKFASNLSAELIENHSLDLTNESQIENYCLKLLETIPQITMAYWGDEQGNFIIARRRYDNTINTEIINTIHKKAINKIYSQQLILLKEIPSPDNYDPRTRLWYTDAKQNQKPTWSNAYIFFSGEHPTLGITHSTPVYSSTHQLMGVFGVDVTLNTLSSFLSQQKAGKNGVAFIINDQGKLIAFPDKNKFHVSVAGDKLTSIKSLNVGWLYQSYREFKHNRQNSFTFYYDDEKYLAIYQLFPGFADKNWWIAIVVPEDDFIGQLKKDNILTLIIFAIILVIGILLILAISKRISKPINQLVEETEKIKSFDLTGNFNSRSYIKEIQLLNNAIASMKLGLRSFQKYVPETLVRQLIDKGEDVKIGGYRQELTIFFSDIKDFTNISENTPPAELMTHLCEYFEEMTQIILHEKGTLDKYIGDSIMAFWGAPLEDKDHYYNACYAALKCQRRLAILNEKWQSQGKPRFMTRIGIHTGSLIVGNLGSSERLNYTVIGDAANLASRLEQINKYYHTYVIISETVQQKVADRFICLPVDRITVKGKNNSLFIYALMADKNEKIDQKLIDYIDTFTTGFAAYQNADWQIAINYFNNCLGKLDDDQIPLLFIERCQFLQNNPPQSWDGIWHYSEK